MAGRNLLQLSSPSSWRLGTCSTCPPVARRPLTERTPFQRGTSFQRAATTKHNCTRERTRLQASIAVEPLLVLHTITMAVLGPALTQVLYGASSAWVEANAWEGGATAAPYPAIQQFDMEGLAGQVLEELLSDSLWDVPTHLPAGLPPTEATARRLTPQAMT